MGEWQEWDAANTVAPVPGDCMVDVLFEDACTYDSVAAAHVCWFSLNRPIVLWRKADDRLPS